ncbi:MAG: LacI family DNA-binding transcriptional regulator [Candidatus Caldatribacterium sp.]|nr:LacI family DNA-binding transcriptional regulator [Candidatus Caldatribacterium sp.]
MPKVNIYTIAKKAGVSPATVSRALNHPEQVSPETRARVLQAIEEHAFTPSILAKRNDTIGIVYDWREGIFRNYYFSRLLNGISSELQKFNYNMLFFARDRFASPQEWRTFLHQHHVGGVILVTPPKDDPRIQPLLALERDVVVLGSREGSTHFVDCENIQSTRIAMQYLFDLGHRAIGFIGGDLTQIDHAERFGAYRSFLEERGLFREEYVHITEDIPSFLSGRGGFEGAVKLLKLPFPPTAIFVGSGNCLLGVLQGLQSMAKRVPDDVSIVCFDDLEEIVPGITSIRQPIERMGRVAAEILVRQMMKGDGTPEPEQRILPCQFIPRGSVRNLFQGRG